MYELIHVPTNTVLGRFKTANEILLFLRENTGWPRSECVAHVYNLVETIKLG